jgi:hypothetical protein
MLTCRFTACELHSDYDVLEKDLRRRIEKSRAQSKKPVVVVTGDYCLGPEDAAKKLISELTVVKVDALNCIDCLFGGKGRFTAIDPEGQRLFLSPGWISYFYDKLKKAKDSEYEENFRNLFKGLEGIVLLDTLGDLNNYTAEIEALSVFTRLPILETKKVGLEKLRDLILEAANRRTAK